MIKIQHQMISYEIDEKVVGFITFPFIRDGVANINHTFTHTEHRGKGIAKELMDALYDYLKEHGFTAVFSCSYAEQYFKRYPEKQDILEKWDQL